MAATRRGTYTRGKALHILPCPGKPGKELFAIRGSSRKKLTHGLVAVGFPLPRNQACCGVRQAKPSRDLDAVVRAAQSLQIRFPRFRRVLLPEMSGIPLLHRAHGVVRSR